MKRTSFLVSVLLLVALAVSSVCAAQAKNVIMMIGDGMGLAHVSLARLAAQQSGGSLNMDTMPYTAFIQTHSANATVTDSGAAGTALATGYKTNNGMIGMLPDGTRVDTILEVAMRMGKSVGLVTTTTISHATPASFGAHVSNRGSEAEIALQLLENRIHVLLGGGKSQFTPGSQGGRDLLGEAKAAGYEVFDTREGLLSAKGPRLLGLFNDGALSTEPPEPTLAEMTAKAIEVLSANDKGFFLMVEGGQIDWKSHSNDTAGTKKQTLDFDAAVGKALDFAHKKPGTLVVVTADHETGGLSVESCDKVRWGSGGHTAVDVPLFAYGFGAYRFRGVMDNTDVPKTIARLWGVKDFASDTKK